MRDYFIPTSGATVSVAEDGTVKIEFYLEEAPEDMLEIEDGDEGSQHSRNIALLDAKVVRDALNRETTDLTITIHPPLVLFKA